MTKTHTLETLATIRNTTTAFLFGLLCLLTQSYYVYAASEADTLASLESQTDAMSVILDNLSSGQVLGAMTGPVVGGGAGSSGSSSPKKNESPRPILSPLMHGGASGTLATSSRPVKMGKGHASSSPKRIKFLEDRIAFLSMRLFEITQKRAEALAELANLKGVDVSTMSDSFGTTTGTGTSLFRGVMKHTGMDEMGGGTTTLPLSL